MKRLLENRQISKALQYIKEDNERTCQELLEMCQIPAPSFHEKEKAEYVMRKFVDIGLEDVYMDEVHNVFGVIRGAGNGPVLMLAAHTDTVFPIDTDLTIKQEGSRYICPGINDDTRAIAELFTIARAMMTSHIRGNGDIIFCANVCEEGLGDLRGVKHIFGKPNVLDGFVTIDNLVTAGIVYTATGSQRFKVHFHGAGGHSFSDFGIPNPVHAMGRAISRIADFQIPKQPKTTFNVGVIKGGTSVNTISAEAEMLVDIRSDSKYELERLVHEMKQAVYLAVESENQRWNSQKSIVENMVTADIELLGVRPAGKQEEDCRIVRAAWDAAKILGLEPELRDESSTDANIPIALGIPAIAVGRGGEEGGIHTVHEWHDPTNAYLGAQKNFLLILALSGYGEMRQYQLPKLEKEQRECWKIRKSRLHE